MVREIQVNWFSNNVLEVIRQTMKESFYSAVWNLAPKVKFSGKLSGETSANLATCSFNEQHKTLLMIMHNLYDYV